MLWTALERGAVNRIWMADVQKQCQIWPALAAENQPFDFIYIEPMDNRISLKGDYS